MCKVSVIIPTYNRPKTLIKAINCVLNQSFKDLEIIVVDDCSKTNVKNIVNELNDKRIKFFRNKTNKGAPHSRNRGLSKAKGEFINFLDDDDIIYPEKLKIQLNKFKIVSKDVGIVTCDVKYNRSDIAKIKKNRKKGRIHKDLLKSYCVYGTETMLIKKKFLEKINGFDEELASNQEYDLQIRLSKLCMFDYVPKLLAEKNTSKVQISFNFDKKLNGTKYLWHKYKNKFKKEKVYTYNYFRFTYLLFKYRIGKYLGKRIYSWMP